MKHFVRILVTVLILGLLGGGVWYFFFREDPDQVVFNRLTETKVHMDDEIYIMSKDKIKFVGYDNILNLVNNSRFSECKQYKVNESTKYVILPESELGYLRANIFGYGSYIGLVQLDELSMDGINYYYSLATSANKVKRDNDLLNLIESYNKKIDNVVNSVKDVIYFHDIKITATPNPSYNKNQGYKDIVDKTYKLYQSILDKQYVQNELFFELRDYVNKYVFGEFVPDYKATSYNIYANQFNEFIEECKTKKVTDLIASKYDSNVRDDLLTVKTNIESFMSKSYTNDYSAKYLDSYKNLEDNGVLVKLIELTHEEKVELKNADYDSSSDEYIDQTLYNSLNLGKLKEFQTTYPSIADDPDYFKDEDLGYAQRDLLLSYITDGQKYAAVGLTDAEFTSAELKAIINGTNPTLASNFTDEVIYNTLREIFLKKANTLENKMAKDAENFGIAKEYLIDAQNVLNYIYEKLV